MTGTPTAEPGRRRTLVRLLVSLAVLVVAYVGLAAVLTRQAPSGTRVAGVSLGGMDHDAARSALERKVAPLAARPVTVTDGPRRTTIDPSAAGLRVDLEDTLEGLTSFSLDPRDVLAHLTGGGERELEVDADDGRLEAALAKARGPLEVKPVDGAISLASGAVRTTEPVAGRTLDAAATADRVEDAWPTSPAIAAAMTEQQPAVGAKAVQDAVAAHARPILAGPVTVTDGTRRGTITPAQLGALTTFVAKDGVLTPRLDAAGLGKAVRKAAPEMEAAPVDATVRLVDGRPRTVPATNGRKVADAALATAVLEATSTPQRTATVTPTPVAPKVTTADVARLGIKEVVSRYDAALPYNPGRTTNIKIAARTIDGTVIKPGQTFSLNGILGERTPAKGYRDALIIQGSRYVKDTGGGVSQVSTSVLNSAFFAGVELVEHRAHSFYITHYPEGREATVHYPSLDNKWRNDGDTGILVHSWVEGGVLKFELWGTKRYDEVRSIKSPRRNVRPPRTIEDDSPTCQSQVPVPGFDVTITRQMVKGGKVVKTDSFVTKYAPQDKVVCTGDVKGQAKRT